MPRLLKIWMHREFAWILEFLLIFPVSSDLLKYILINYSWGFLGGSVVKDLPASVADSGSIPDLRRSHVWGQRSHSCRASALEPECPRTPAPKQDRAPLGEAPAPRVERSPHLWQLEKCLSNSKDPA